MDPMQAQMQSDSKSVWRLDSSHSSVEFTAKKFLVFTVKGRLTDLDGTIVLDENAVSGSSVQAGIGAANINTGNKQRDAKLRSVTFLDASSYAQIRFESSKVAHGQDRDTLKVEGSLTIKGRSRDVVLDVTEVDRSKAPGGDEVIYYVAEAVLDRYDFGINAWRGVIGPKLKVVINVQANRV
jgi:polyisoprenoid-binding protein YceI